MTLSVHEFGRELIRQKDLDPVYVLLHEASLSRTDLQRWLVSYWCFYHVGTASAIAYSEEEYWDRMDTAAGSKEWPRSSERRHFRGAAAKKSVDYLQRRGVTNLFQDVLGDGKEINARDLTQVVQQWVGFGPWIAFKVVDMLERLGIRSVRFDLSTAMYSSPLAGADLFHREAGSPPTSDVAKWAVDSILRELGKLKAPPRYERAINFQEVETILCKWHSYRKGHYHLGEDVTACRRGLLRYARNPMAQRLIAAGGKGGLW